MNHNYCDECKKFTYDCGHAPHIYISGGTSNEYAPWIELGMTEAQYFSKLYIESEKKLATARAALEFYSKDVKRLMITKERFANSDEIQSYDVTWVEQHVMDNGDTARQALAEIDEGNE